VGKHVLDIEVVKRAPEEGLANHRLVSHYQLNFSNIVTRIDLYLQHQFT